MSLLTGKQILDANDQTITKVEVPEWGEEAFVFVKTISAGERDALDNSLFDFIPETGQLSRNANDYRAKWCQVCICDESGNSLFTPEDIPALSAKSSKAIARCFRKAQELNGVTDDEVKRLEKNSESVQDS